jgi:hypothetical protein
VRAPSCSAPSHLSHPAHASAVRAAAAAKRSRARCTLQIEHSTDKLATRAHSLCASAGELGGARRGSEPGAGGDAGDGPAGLLAESGARGGRRTCARGGRSLRAPCRARRHAPAPSCGVRRRRARAGAPGAREAAPPGSGAVAAPSGGREARTVLHRGAGRCASAAAPSLAAPFSHPPRFTGCLDRLPVITGSGSGGSATRTGVPGACSARRPHISRAPPRASAIAT